MNPDEFVHAVHQVCVIAPQRGLAKFLRHPSGRSPRPEDRDLSEWFAALPATDQRAVLAVARRAAELATFNFLSVLDGVLPIEGPGPKSSLELWQARGHDRTLLNPPEGEMLHDLLPE